MGSDQGGVAAISSEVGREVLTNKASMARARLGSSHVAIWTGGTASAISPETEVGLERSGSTRRLMRLE